jgi:hypothetical protein
MATDLASAKAALARNEAAAALTVAREVTCECGAVYRVEGHATPVPDTDNADCEVCGKRLAAWHNSKIINEYTLIKRPLGK